MTGDLDTLRSVVSSGGQVCGPDDRGYAEAVRIWNAAIERRPSVVVRCSTAADVAAALDLATGSSSAVALFRCRFHLTAALVRGPIPLEN
jgi:hypothetical protein